MSDNATKTYSAIEVAALLLLHRQMIYKMIWAGRIVVIDGGISRDAVIALARERLERLEEEEKKREKVRENLQKLLTNDV